MRSKSHKHKQVKQMAEKGNTGPGQLMPRTSIPHRRRQLVRLAVAAPPQP